MTDPIFIEILKVIADKESQVNTGSNKTTINVADIKSFRAWHKGRNDKMIRGEMTIVVLNNETTSSVMENGQVKDGTDKGYRSILIEEGYDEFKHRLSVRAVIKDIDRKLHDIT